MLTRVGRFGKTLGLPAVAVRLPRRVADTTPFNVSRPYLIRSVLACFSSWLLSAVRSSASPMDGRSRTFRILSVFHAERDDGVVVRHRALELLREPRRRQVRRQAARTFSTRTATPQSERWLRDAGRGDNVIGARVPESGSRHTRRGFVSSPDLRALAVVRVAIGLQAGAQNDLRPALRLDDLLTTQWSPLRFRTSPTFGALSLMRNSWP